MTYMIRSLHVLWSCRSGTFRILAADVDVSSLQPAVNFIAMHKLLVWPRCDRDRSEDPLLTDNHGRRAVSQNYIMVTL